MIRGWQRWRRLPDGQLGFGYRWYLLRSYGWRSSWNCRSNGWRLVLNGPRRSFGILPRLGGSNNIRPTEPRGFPFTGAFEPLPDVAPSPSTFGNGGCLAPGGCHAARTFCSVVPGTCRMALGGNWRVWHDIPLGIGY